MLQNYVRWAAGASLLVLMLGLAVFNLTNWLSEGFYILAVVALCAELIGFVMAVMVEIAIRARRWLAAGVCGLILVVCAGFNIIGAERAWDASTAHHINGARMEAQDALDANRAELGDKLGRANRVIESYSHLLPDADTYRARQAGMQAAWEMATAQARGDALSAQRELDRLPVVAEVSPPFETWQVQAGFGFAELIKALGLWACGFGAALLVHGGNAKPNEETPQPLEGTDETVVVFTGDLKETVRRLRASGVSYGEIEKKTKVPKGTAWKWCNPTENQAA